MSNSLSGACLLLTATITPPAAVPGLQRVNPADRLKDYLEALAFYLALPDQSVSRIVFVDNSASDVSALQDLVKRAGGRKQVEVVSFAGLDYPSGFGRTYGELRLIAAAFEQSAILRQLPDTQMFWKCTGRLRVLNLPAMIRSPRQEVPLLMDFHRLPSQWVELRLFATSKAGFREFLQPLTDQVREDRIKTWPENELFHLLSKRLPDPQVVQRFRCQPRFAGVGGYHGLDYNSGANRARYHVRRLMRQIAPWLWI